MKKSKLNRLVTISKTCEGCHVTFHIKMLETQYDNLSDKHTNMTNSRILSSTKEPYIKSEMIALILNDRCGYCEEGYDV